MITIRKKLAEQAANSDLKRNDGKEIKRRLSIRSQLLTSGKYKSMCVFSIQNSSHAYLCFPTEVSELGEVLPREFY